MRDRFFLALAWAAFFLLCWICLVRNEAHGDRLPVPALRVAWGDGPLRLDGQVPDEVTKARLALEIERLDPENTVVNLITVGSQDLTAGWLPTVVGVVRAVSGRVGRGQLEFSAATVTIRGDVPDAAARTTVLGGARAAAGRLLGVGDQLTVVAQAPKSTVERTPAEVQADLRRVLAGRTVEFESASSVLTMAGRGLLDELVPILKANPNLAVAVDGHTDSSGVADDNLTLSEARAESVRTYLVARGLAADRVTAQGFGATRPLVDNSTPAGRKQNRRIEFRVSRP